MSIKDNSYDSLLEVIALERLDITSHVPLAIREEIRDKRKSLKAGFFIDWDYEKKKFYEGKVWDV